MQSDPPSWGAPITPCPCPWASLMLDSGWLVTHLSPRAQEPEGGPVAISSPRPRPPVGGREGQRRDRQNRRHEGHSQSPQGAGGPRWPFLGPHLADEAWRCPILPAGHSGKYCLFRKLVLPPGIYSRVQGGEGGLLSHILDLQPKQETRESGAVPQGPSI